MTHEKIHATRLVCTSTSGARVARLAGVATVIASALIVSQSGLAVAQEAAASADNVSVRLQRLADRGFAGSLVGSNPTHSPGPLRGGDHLAPARAEMPQNPQPCLNDERYTHFDFWIGEWEVHGPRGQLAGHNSITKALNGCTVFEQWTSAQGGEGKSFNYFDPSTNKWRQLWIDGGGNLIPIEGDLVDGSMAFTGRHILPTGEVRAFKETYTPLDDGRVRQFIEESLDGGETWAVWFDGYYTRIEAGSGS